jgi:hypothetical protein
MERIQFPSYSALKEKRSEQETKKVPFGIEREEEG